MPLTREQLDSMGCSMPNCDHDHSVLYLEPACHPGSGTDVIYAKENGTLQIVCHVCEKPVAHIQVAKGWN